TLMDVPMHNVTRFVALLLTAVTLGVLAALPLVAAWKIPAGQCVAPVSLDPLKPGEQMPLVARQCAISGSALKQPDLKADWLDWGALRSLYRQGGECGAPKAGDVTARRDGYRDLPAIA